MWKGGSEPPFLHHFRLCRHSRLCGHSGREFPEAIFCAQAWYLSNFDLASGLQIEPEAPREPKDGQRRPREGQRHPHGTQMMVGGRAKGSQRGLSEPKGTKSRSKSDQREHNRLNYINKLPINRLSGRYVNMSVISILAIFWMGLVIFLQ